MSKPNRIELHHDMNVILDPFLKQPPETLQRLLRVLCFWEQASPLQRAMALKLLNERLTDKQVADLSGVSLRQLQRYPEYRRFTRFLRDRRRLPRRGFRGPDGELEAWSEG
jgi:hypothetical protein